MEMIFPKEIETARLTLRKLTQADAEALFEAYEDPHHLRYMVSRPHRSQTDTRQYIEDSMRRWEAGDRKEYTIVWRATGEVLGSTGAYIANGRVSLGIVVAPHWSGKRIAIEATKGMIGLLQTMPEAFRIWAFCESTHEASRTVLRRIGFREEGIVHTWARFPNLGTEARDCRFFYFPKDQPIAPEPGAELP